MDLRKLHFPLFIILTSLALTGCECLKKQAVIDTMDSLTTGSPTVDEVRATGRRPHSGQRSAQETKPSTSAGRSPEAISQWVKSHTDEVQECFRRVKLREPKLNGKVKILFVIAPSGEVLAVKVAHSSWNNRELGAEAEKCITEEIHRWRFEAVDERAGNVTASSSYTFE